MSQEDQKDDRSRMERIKQHLVKHKTIYLCGTTAIVCVVGGRYIYRAGARDLAKQIVEQMPTPSVINNHNVGNLVSNTVATTGNNAGPMHKIVKCINKDGTVEIWESLGEAARACADRYNLKPSSMAQMISKNANGHISDVYGDVFTYIGTATG